MRKSLLLVLLPLLIFHLCSAQKTDQQVVDSLLQLLPQAPEDTDKVNILYQLSLNYPYINPDAGIKYGKEALTLAQKLSWTKGIAGAYSAIGGNHANKAEYAKALENEYHALELYEQMKDLRRQASLNRYIGIVHHNSNNQKKALEYDSKALHLYEALNDSEGIAAIYNNMANVYYSLHNWDKVIENDISALRIYEMIGNAAGIARVTGNIANFYAERGDYSQAMFYYFKALRLETALGNFNGVTRNMGNIGETYLDIYRDTTGLIKADSLIPADKKANLQKALYYLKTAVANAKQLQQTEYVMASEEILWEAYRLAGDPEMALRTYQDFIVIRDSIYDVQKYNDATRREMSYEFGKKEDSIKYQQRLTDVMLSDEKRSRTRDSIFYSIGLVLVLIFSVFMFNRWRITQKQKKIIEKEKQRSDDLLLNILPSEVAEELKETGTAKARSFENVTVLFTDFKNFTQTSETLSPEELVKEINYCYSEFDKIITKYGIEKIKTIGDSYMCAGGLPAKMYAHPWDVVKAGFELQEFITKHKAERIARGESFFELRLGIHTGPVVAGIVGIKKFAYDIWGDTVNTASRMESSGEVGKVNISGTTFELIKDKFKCTYRGKVKAKNKGEVDMYFVEEEL